MPHPDQANPFFPGLWTPNHFYGRAFLCQRFYERITACADFHERLEGRHFEVTGLPGIGRTSLLRFLADPKGAARRHSADLPTAFQNDSFRLLPVLVEFERRPPEQHPFEYLWHRFLATLQAAGADIGNLTAETAEIAVDKSKAVEHIRHITGKLGRQRWLCFLLLDDFDQALRDDLVTDADARKLGQWKSTNCMMIAGRSKLCDNPKLTAVASGSSIGESTPSSFLRAIESETLEPLSFDEACQCLLQRSNNQLTGDDADTLCCLSGGHPDILLRAAGVLWDLKLRTAPSAGLIADQPRLPDQWIKSSISAHLKGILNEIAEAAISPDLCIALARQKSGSVLNEDLMIPLYDGVVSGVLRANPRSQERQFWFFSPLLDDYLAKPAAGRKPLPTRAVSSFAVGDPGKLSRTETRLYTYLRHHEGETCKFDELWQDVWESQEADGKARRTIQVTVSRLREKLGAVKARIEPVRHEGYRYWTIG